MAIKKWVIVSIDQVLADSTHREHLRPQYRRNHAPSHQETLDWMATSIDDTPIANVLAVVGPLMDAGNHLIVVGSKYFPLEKWLTRHAPQLDQTRVWHVKYPTGTDYAALREASDLKLKGYEEWMFQQLRFLRNRGDGCTMAIMAAPQYQTMVRYLWPDALVTGITPKQGVAANKRVHDSTASRYDQRPALPDRLLKLRPVKGPSGWVTISSRMVMLHVPNND